MAKAKHPMQPIVKVGKVYRFKKNNIVRYLLDYATERGCGLNELARLPFSTEDWVQLYQLIGYSVSGFGDLGLPRRIVREADQIVDQMISKRKRQKQS